MRRLSGVLLAGAMLMVPAFSHERGRPVRASGAAEDHVHRRRRGDPAFAVNPDKTADYEKVLAQLKDALAKSEAPGGQAAAGGLEGHQERNAAVRTARIVYIHIITPVVKDADYSVINNIYAVVKDPAEQKAVYDMYRGALKQALFVIQGPMVADLSK